MEVFRLLINGTKPNQYRDDDAAGSVFQELSMQNVEIKLTI